MKLTVVGIDPSSRKLAAVVMPPDGPFNFHTCAIPPKSLPTRCVLAYNWTRNLIQSVGRCIVVLEAPVSVAGRGSIRAVIPQARVNGAISAAALRSGAIDVLDVSPSQWKMDVISVGDASKHIIAKHVLKVWPALYHAAQGDQDVLDSGCMALYGKHVVDRRGRITAARRVRQGKQG